MSLNLSFLTACFLLISFFFLLLSKFHELLNSCGIHFFSPHLISNRHFSIISPNLSLFYLPSFRFLPFFFFYYPNFIHSCLRFPGFTFKQTCINDIFFLFFSPYLISSRHFSIISPNITVFLSAQLFSSFFFCYPNFTHSCLRFLAFTFKQTNSNNFFFFFTWLL